MFLEIRDMSDRVIYPRGEFFCRADARNSVTAQIEKAATALPISVMNSFVAFDPAENTSCAILKA